MWTHSPPCYFEQGLLERVNSDGKAHVQPSAETLGRRYQRVHRITMTTFPHGLPGFAAAWPAILSLFRYGLPHSRYHLTSAPAGDFAGITHPQTIKLNPQYVKSSSTAPSKSHFDQLIPRSENKPVYSKVARNHVTSTIEGYNSVMLAYRQMASGKTFML